MRILQVNTVYGTKSTGNICLDIERTMTALGHQCFTAYGHGGKPRSPMTYRINRKMEYYWHNLLSRVTGLEGYFSWWATHRLIRFIRRLDPDIVHLHNLHGHYLHLPSFFRYLEKAKKPVVLTLHDCWIFTGKCTCYSERRCHRWRDACCKCPALGAYPTSYFFDWTRKMHEDKKRWLRAIDRLHVIGVSDWIADEARLSFLGMNPVTRAYNWVDRSVFKPYDGRLPESMGIAPAKFTILGVSAGWVKGSARYDDFMALANMIDESMQIVLVGNARQPIKHPRIVHIPFVENRLALAKLYSASDVYVHLSVEDTFGLVIVEAMACGTPVVAYDATACGEIATDACGRVVAARDVGAVYRAVKSIASRPKAAHQQACVKRVEEEFDYLTNTLRIVHTYSGLMR